MIRTTFFVSPLLLGLFLGCGDDSTSPLNSVDSDKAKLSYHWTKLQSRNGKVYLPNSEIPFDGVVRSNYPNGQTYVLARFDKGLMQKFKRWEEDGTSQLQGNFSDCEVEDLTSLFEVNASKANLDPEYLARGTKKLLFREQLALFPSSSKDGQWKQWYSNGEEMHEFHYLHGQCHGVAYSWAENGQLLSERHFASGRPEGPWLSYYHPEGHLSEERHFHEGLRVGMWSKWFPNGQMSEKCFYSKGIRNGVFMQWHENGQLSNRSIYRDSMLNGLSQEFSPSGQLVAEARYKDGRKWGLEKAWHENGSQHKKVFRNNKGQLHGRKENWYMNGNRSTLEYFEDGYLIAAKSWKPSGEANPEEVKDGSGTLIGYGENGERQEFRFSDGEMISD